MKVVMVMRHAILAAIASALLNGCAAIDRIKSIGQQPPLASVDNPTTRPGYKPVQMPMPAAQPAAYNPNSLWRNGSRAFFKDQRAHQVGDILTVTVNLNDKAVIANETQRSRENKTRMHGRNAHCVRGDSDSSLGAAAAERSGPGAAILTRPGPMTVA